eukprot:gnl/TRDRNA2_/TRDRNA2_81412_c0_seq2.p1 gnl/TRDRNA2_/TRDRNA2_81412_c0~~gnl/TRDRNA2_/TRDRNA2_81412_c0_seq2.p1  ORF type:complete len:361 (-),score=93.37 gnl/TRDRNA2_/TRDRNA2_81412_c0_seq2:40-1122(-)
MAHAGREDVYGAAGPVGDDEDAELARAIEASYASQRVGVDPGERDAMLQASEEEMIQEAIRLSQLEAEGKAEVDTSRKGDTAAQAETGVANPGHGRGASSAAGLPPPVRPDELPMSASTGNRWSRPRRDPIPMEEDGDSDAPMQEFLPDDTPRGIGREEGEEMLDPHLAAAIEASYHVQTEGGMMSHEDDLVAQAIRLSQTEEETRQRNKLREQQEMELEESMLMDQIRESEERKRRVEEAQLLEQEASKQAADQERRMQDFEAKKARIPAEPVAGEAGRVDVQIRLPDGRRMRRAFRSGDTVGTVYDYVDVEGGEAVNTQGAYRLVSTMPRRAYEDRSLSLQDAGLQGQCALLVEAITA